MITTEIYLGNFKHTTIIFDWCKIFENISFFSVNIFYLQHLKRNLDFDPGRYGEWRAWTDICRGGHYNGAQLATYRDQGYGLGFGYAWDNRGAITLKMICSDGIIHQVPTVYTAEQ